MTKIVTNGTGVGQLVKRLANERSTKERLADKAVGGGTVGERRRKCAQMPESWNKAEKLGDAGSAALNTGSFRRRRGVRMTTSKVEAQGELAGAVATQSLRESGG
jgi:hypothetical protein